jgi:transposase
VLITKLDGSVERQMRTFTTMTNDLLEMAAWLDGLQVTHVAMESTGVYWRPVFNVLEDDRRTLLLVNPQHMRAVPGKKTDVKDAEWIADLLRHGLLQASFIPAAPIRALRELTRYRKTLVQERGDEVNRLHKLLEAANIKLASVATDVLGVSGRAMFAALLDGERDPEVLADLACGTLRKKLPNYVRRWSATSRRITSSCSGRSWRTSTSSHRRLLTCRLRSSCVWNRLSTRSSCYKRFRASRPWPARPFWPRSA